MTGTKYYGWIIVETKPGYMDRIYAEYVDEDNTRKRVFFDTAQEAVEWWDKRLNHPVALLPTLKGCFRVYITE